MSLGKTNIKQCTMTCQFELDIGPGTAKSTVESNLNIGPVQVKYPSGVKGQICVHNGEFPC